MIEKEAQSLRKEEIEKNKQKLKTHVGSLEEVEKGLRELVLGSISQQIPETKKFQYYRIKSIEMLTNSYEKVLDLVLKYRQAIHSMESELLDRELSESDVSRSFGPDMWLDLIKNSNLQDESLEDVQTEEDIVVP